MVIAVAVTIVTSGAAAAAAASSVTGSSVSLGAGISLAVGGSVAVGGATLSATAFGLAVFGGIGAVAGSIVSQAVGVATGLQDKFSWGAVALAGLSAVVGGAAGGLIKGAGLGANIARGVGGNLVTQGIGVATGLQSRFDWAGVAAAGASAIAGFAAGRAVGRQTSVEGIIAGRAVAVSARTIAGAAARSLIDGTSFGDNIMAVLPDAIGQTIGDIVSDALTGRLDAELAENRAAKAAKAAKAAAALSAPERSESVPGSQSGAATKSGLASGAADDTPADVIVTAKIYDAVYWSQIDTPLILQIGDRPVEDLYVKYVAYHRSKIRDIANELGLPLEAIPVAVGEEYRVQPRLFGARLKDRFLENNGLEMIENSVRPIVVQDETGPVQIEPAIYSRKNQYVEAEYSKYRKVIESENGVVQRAGFLGRNVHRLLGALDSPIANDIGYGNINYGRAIYLVKVYWGSSLSKDDALELNPYKGRLDRLYADLINPKSNATWAIAGLALKDVQNRYLNFPGVNSQLKSAIRKYYLGATPAEKTLLLDLGYRNSVSSVRSIFSLDPKTKGLVLNRSRLIRSGVSDYFKSDQYKTIVSTMYRR